jgi:hypothetical protein
MSKRSRKSRSKRHIDVRAAVEQIHAAAEAMDASRSRYAAYDFLLAVYTPYWDWFDEGLSDEHIKSSILRTSGQRHSHNEHPLKMLIRAARCSPEAKILSRWVRALEYALLKTIRPQHLIYFFEHRGGIAGCARSAARYEPKRATSPERDSWADDEETYSAPGIDHSEWRSKTGV